MSRSSTPFLDALSSLLARAALAVFFRRRVRFLGKSTLWEIPPLRPFLALVGVIPIYRPSDPGVDPSKNRETFARCREALLAGEAIALFPERTSHTQPALLVLGAAPITGWLALLVWERGLRLVKESRAYLLLRTRRELGGRLRALRARVRREVGALAEIYARGG